MTKQELRNTIIDLLDDDQGINSKGHDGLVELCVENGWQDINNATEMQDGRAFLGEEDAADLRLVVVEG